MSAVPERWRQLGADGLVHALRGLDREGDRQIIATLVLRPVLADLRERLDELGHTNICSIQLHERNPYRQCTCFQKYVLALIDGAT